MGESLSLEDQFFREALEQARSAFEKDELPIGAVLVKDGEIIFSAHNQTETEGSFLAHAEMICLKEASQKLRTKYLEGCSLYVTLEPCRMCAAAASLSRIENIYYLTSSDLFGKTGSGYKEVEEIQIKSDLTPQATILLQNFFKKMRETR